jgi:hypothetical protein
VMSRELWTFLWENDNIRSKTQSSRMKRIHFRKWMTEDLWTSPSLSLSRSRRLGVTGLETWTTATWTLSWDFSLNFIL